MRRRKLVTTYLIGVTLRNSTLLLLRSSVRVTYKGEYNERKRVPCQEARHN